MLRVEGVTVRFGSTVALDDVSIDLAEGERLAVLGPQHQNAPSAGDRDDSMAKTATATATIRITDSAIA